jgi:signal transduction histidine kinase
MWRMHAWDEIQAVRHQGRESLHDVSRQRKDKVVFDSLRDRLDTLQRQMARLVGDEVARLGAAQREVEMAMEVAMVLAGLALAATVGLLHFALTRPLSRLTGQLEAVSCGEYDRRIDASGPQEVRQIAEAAESMRMSIVDRSADLVAAQHELSVQTERQRVAADLHDTTIQRLFGLGLKLSALASQRTELAGTLNSLIDEADEIIRELRRMIFQMNEDEIRAKAASSDAGEPGDQPWDVEQSRPPAARPPVTPLPVPPAPAPPVQGPRASPEQTAPGTSRSKP